MLCKCRIQKRVCQVYLDAASPRKRDQIDVTERQSLPRTLDAGILANGQLVGLVERPEVVGDSLVPMAAKAEKT
jgi:hypothetical protein